MRKQTRPAEFISVLRLLLVTIVVLGVRNVQAQQDPYLTHYMFNKMQFNPAYAGSSERICIAGIYHTQWTGLEDRTLEYYSDNDPKSFNSGVGARTTGVSFNAPLRVGKRLSYGVGATILKDNIGYENSLKARGDFAVRYQVSNNSKIAFGVEAGVLQKGIDGTKFKFRDPLDVHIPRGQVSAAKPNVGVGLYYTNSRLNDLYLGLSSTNFKEERYNYPGGKISNVTSSHYYFMSGLKYGAFLGNNALEFNPSMLAKLSNTLQFTFSGLVEYAQTFSGGLAYRTEADAASILLGYRLKNGMRLGYSYDVSLNALRKFSGGTHEIQVNYCFKLPIVVPPGGGILTPRWLNRDPKNLDILMNRKSD